MSARRPPGPSGFSRLDIARAVALMVVAVLVVGAAFDGGDERALFPAPVASPASLPPIAAEADVFRLRHADLGVAPSFSGNGRGHVRSPDIYRRLRAYPGAPPRIPHGLTSGEFEETRCNVCHERGGWVARFGSYAPVTPHPELASCLQCHVPSDELVGRPRPTSSDALVCDQCHVDPDAPPPTFVSIEWRPAPWPAEGEQAMDGSPHVIPHDLHLRGNCVACHAGPGSVVGLRTDHPERANCRQCHVAASTSEGVWPTESPAGGGAP